jgi:hypothetical protein
MSDRKRDNKDTEKEGRTFLGAYEPPKPISEMTDEEIDQFAEFLFEQVSKQLEIENKDEV